MARKKISGKEKIMTAALDLARHKPWREIEMGEIAQAAGIPLAQLRGEFASKSAILVCLAALADEQMLASVERQAVEGSAQDRLFEVIMRRLEVLEPYKQSIAAIVRERPVGGPGEIVQLGLAADTSAHWMLMAAGISQAGCAGAARRAGLIYVMNAILPVWASDDDPGLATTMARLDRHLRAGAKWLNRLEVPCGLANAFSSLARGFMKGRRREGRADGSANGAATA